MIILLIHVKSMMMLWKYKFWTQYFLSWSQYGSNMILLVLGNLSVFFYFQWHRFQFLSGMRMIYHCAFVFKVINFFLKRLTWTFLLAKDTCMWAVLCCSPPFLQSTLLLKCKKMLSQFYWNFPGNSFFLTYVKGLLHRLWQPPGAKKLVKCPKWK